MDYWWIKSNTISEIRSNVTNEIDKRKNLELGENEVDVCV